MIANHLSRSKRGREARGRGWEARYVREDTHRGDLGVLPVPAGRVVVGHQTTHGGSSVVGRQWARAARSGGRNRHGS